VFYRRLEDKIRHLCQLATITKNEDAWLVMSELRLLIRQHVAHLRLVAAGRLSGTREFLERRAGQAPPKSCSPTGSASSEQ
jgi:hypothetical protein